MQINQTVEQLVSENQRLTSIIYEKDKQILQLKQLIEHYRQKENERSDDQLKSSKNINGQQWTGNISSHSMSSKTKVLRVPQTNQAQPNKPLCSKDFEQTESETPRISSEVSKSQTERVYESIHLVGCNEQILEDFGAQNNINTKQVNSQLIQSFSYKNIYESFPQTIMKHQIEQLIFPNGVMIQSMEQDLLLLNQIMFTNFDNINQHFVILVKDNQKQNQTLYYVCCLFEDFYFCKRNQQQKIVKHQRVLCISTKMPIVQQCILIIKKILSQIKIKRLAESQKFANDSIQEYSRLDCRFVQNIIFDKSQPDSIGRFFNKLALIDGAKFKKFDLDIIQPSQTVNLEPTTYKWAAQIVFTSFTFEQIVKIFLLILIEQSVIFVGTARWISGCMLFFTEIIKPIEWIHPLISSLPYDKLDILESPTPILASMLGHDEVTSDHPITSVHELMDGTCIIQNIQITLNKTIVQYFTSILQNSHSQCKKVDQGKDEKWFFICGRNETNKNRINSPLMDISEEELMKVGGELQKELKNILSCVAMVNSQKPDYNEIMKVSLSNMERKGVVMWNEQYWSQFLQSQLINVYIHSVMK